MKQEEIMEKPEDDLTEVKSEDDSMETENDSTKTENDLMEEKVEKTEREKLILKPLSDLPGVGPVTQKKLEGAGIFSILDITTRSPRSLADLTGMDKEAAEKLYTKAHNVVAEAGIMKHDWESGLDVLKERQEREKISTGVDELNDLFGGGIETQAITELYGEFGSGKTQICHQLAVQVQLPKEDGGLDGNVLYIDTEHTFRPERLISIAEAKGLDPEAVLSRIQTMRTYNASHQIMALESASKKLQEGNVKLLIVDSCVGLFRAEYLGRGTLSERQQRLNYFVHLLSRMGETYNVACVITNQVQHNPGQLIGDPTKPIGGNIVGHTSTYRVYLKKYGKKRVAVMKDSPHLPDAEVKFTVNDYGLDKAV